MKKLITLFLLSFLFSLPSFGYSYNFDDIQTKAEDGDAQSQYLLGYIYYYGNNVSDENRNNDLVNTDIKQDINRAFKWLSRSAEKNDPNAQYLLATMYQKGEGTEQNYDKAIKLLNKSAKQNNTDALMILGSMYYDGALGAKQNYEDSFKNYEQAANGRTWYIFGGITPNNHAQYLLANMYFDGKGTKQNYSKAMKYYKQSVENISQGFAEPTPENKKWLYDACYKIGYLYDNGLGVDQDQESALRWYTTSSNGGNADATYQIGLQYEKSKDVNKAQEYFGLAFEQGNKNAENKLDANGTFQYGYKQYNKGNFAGAITYFQKSIDMGSSDGTPETYIGNMYKNGYGVAKSNSEAFTWYRKGADKGNIEAQNKKDEISSETLNSTIQTGAKLLSIFGSK